MSLLALAVEPDQLLAELHQQLAVVLAQQAVAVGLQFGVVRQQIETDAQGRQRGDQAGDQQ